MFQDLNILTFGGIHSGTFMLSEKSSNNQTKEKIKFKKPNKNIFTIINDEDY